MTNTQLTQELPPPAVLMKLMAGKCITQALATAAHLRVADHLKDGPRSAEAIAPGVGAHPQSLYRLLRALATVGVLVEHADRTFTLTAVGQFLRTDVPGSLAAMAELFGEPLQWAAWSELTDAVRTNTCAFHKVHGMSVYEAVAAHPELAAMFNAAMTGMSGQLIRSIVAAYDYSQFAAIADIGGGQGLVLTAILEAHPAVRGVLFDQPSVVAGAKQRIADAGLAGRCELLAGDFFETAPAGCDAYLIKNVLHDWGDDACVRILRQCATRMAPGAKVLVLEQVLPPPGVPSFSKIADLEMLVATSGRERTDAEFAQLFAQAELRLARCVPTQGPLQIIEAVHA
jgi:O-methyltransferase/methyltransferase family protein